MFVLIFFIDLTIFKQLSLEVSKWCVFVDIVDLCLYYNSFQHGSICVASAINGACLLEL